MMRLETVQIRQANQMEAFRPRMVAIGPARGEERKAPRFMSEEISCWRVVDMFQPPGSSRAGWPKTCGNLVSISLISREILD